MTAYPLLFSPLTIRGRRLPSRAVFTAHTVSYGEQGVPGERARAYYEARAAGGAGLIVMEPLPVLPNAGTTPQNYRFDAPGFGAGLRRVVDAVHAHGTVFVSQLYHLGPNSDPLAAWGLEGGERWGPMAVRGAGGPDVVRAMNADDIAVAITAHVRAAEAPLAAGVDGVECMFAYDTLVDQFIDPALNGRDDDYGGDLAGRCRLAVEILQALRAAIGPDLLLGLTVSAATGDIVAAVAHIARRCDIDYVGVGNGNYERLHLTIPPMEVAPGFGVPFAAAVKRVVPSLAVIAEGRINRPEIAEDALASGACDLAGMTRALIADPQLLRKAADGRSAEIRECVGYNMCIARRLRKFPVACAQNPAAGHELDAALVPVADPRHVVVVGGGLAGLEAARVSAERGHRVTLLERGDRVGGQAALLAELPLQVGFAELVAWRARELDRLGIDVRTATPTDAAMVAALQPDVAVVATGSRPVVPHGTLAAVDVLAGRTSPGAGERWVVIDEDGHRKGAGTAEWLAARGGLVTLVAINGSAVRELDASKIGPLYLSRLAAAGVALIEGHRLVHAGANAVRLARCYDGTELELVADHVVVASPHRACDELVAALAGLGLPVHVIGDARAPRLIEDAIRDGYALGARL